MGKPFELTVTRTIAAPRAEVFEAWLDPQALVAIMRPAPNMTVPTVEVDPRVGGRFLVVMRAGEDDYEHRGEYREISRYDRLVFTWLSGMTLPSSVVTVQFRELGPAETAVTLHHVGLPDQETCDDHRGGWAAILAALAGHVA